jgi:tetratricopeptide (TPR) repeat protein
MIDDFKEARRVILWAENQRDIPGKGSYKRFTSDQGDEEELDDFEHHDENSANSFTETAALCMAHAFIFLQCKDYTNALKYSKLSLKCDSRYSPAWRCIALVEWQQQLRQQAVSHFKKSLDLFPMNPYCLRSAAIANAIIGNYQDAVFMIQAAVEIGGNTNPLAWRAAGQITYLYDLQPNSKERAITYMLKAYELSNGLDFEAGRLLAQVRFSLLFLRPYNLDTDANGAWLIPRCYEYVANDTSSTTL